MSTALDTFLPLPAPEWPQGLPDHLSQSSLSMFERCPEMWRRKYILRESEPPSDSLLWGNADTKAHALNFTQKIETHEDISLDDVQLAFAEILDREIEGYGGASEVDWGNETPGGIKDRGVALVATYHRQVSPRVQPIAVEERFELEIPGVAIPFIGYVDVETEPSAIERKTAGAKATSIPPHYRLQTLSYALAKQKPVELHISAKTKVPGVFTPFEEEGLLQPFDQLLALKAERVLASRARHLRLLFETYGPDEPWPDAIGTMAWHVPICELCGWGPKGSNKCVWWK